MTVLFDLNPLLVMSHFLVAVVVIGLAAVLARAAWPPARDVRASPAGSPGSRSRSVLAGFGLIVSGAFATAAGPHAGGEDIRRLGDLLDATYVHVRVAIAYIIIAGVLCSS